MNYRNAKHIANGLIDCEIEHPVYGWIPFTCDRNDTGAAFDVAALYAEMNADQKTAAYIPPTQAELNTAQAQRIRDTRDEILVNIVDPLATNPLRWADLTAEKQAEWAAYRHALLNIPQQESFPINITWPTKPD